MAHLTPSLARSVAQLLMALVLVDFSPRAQGRRCPTLAAQQVGGDLDLGHFSAYLDDEYFSAGSGSGLGGRVELISDGEVSATFSSASSDPFPSRLSPLLVHLQLNTTAPQKVYYLFNVWSLDSSTAPPGCPLEGQLLPGEDFVNEVNLSCVEEGEVVLQGCLTLGTAPFNSLRGTYKTLELYFLGYCEGPTTSECKVRAQDEVVPGEMCITLNQTQQLVTNPTGSWGVLLAALTPNNEEVLRGYCVIDEFVSETVGLATFVADPSLRPMLPIAENFPELEMYLGLVTGAGALAFSISFTSTNTSILEAPYVVPVTQGVVEGNTLIYLKLPCVGPGFVEVPAVINMSTVVNGTLYFQTYVFAIFRNCTPANQNYTTPSIPPHTTSTDTARVTLLAVLIPGLLLLLATTLAVLVMALLTRRIMRREMVTLRQFQSTESLSSNTAYQMKTIKTPFDCLKELDMEYNYPGLEVVGELGEGAFGRVFKARAPGLERGDFVPEFVAMKTLKEVDMSEDFCKEVKAVVRFSHPNIVRLLAICTTTAQKCMIFEYMALGGLDDLLRKSDPDNPAAEVDCEKDVVLITPSDFLHCCLQVARGVAYLAEQKYVHRDIASRNCLVDGNLVVKIGDFGLSRDLSSMDYYRVGGTQACLPIRWMPPEALLFGKFTTQSDVWSFGVLMWEIHTFGRQPYTGLSNHEVIDAVKASKILECPRLCPASIFDVMKVCWTRSPLKRPNMDVVVGRLQRLLSPGGGEGEGEGGEGGRCVVYVNLEYGAQVESEELEESVRVGKELCYDKMSGEATKTVPSELEGVNTKDETTEISNFQQEPSHIGEDDEK